MVPVQRERVVPPVPAEKTEGGAMDRPLLHRRGPRSARPTAGDPSHESPTGCRTTAQGAGGRMAGPRLVAAAHGRLRVLWPDRCAHARVPGDHLPMGLLQQAASGTLGAVPAARAQAAPQARRQEDASRFPIPGRVPISERRRRPTAGARSAIGEPTASSEWDATCTPR